MDQDRAFSALVRALGSVCEARGSGDGVRPSWGRNRDARSVFRGQEWRSRGPISSAADLESFRIHRRQISELGYFEVAGEGQKREGRIDMRTGSASSKAATQTSSPQSSARPIQLALWDSTSAYHNGAPMPYSRLSCMTTKCQRTGYRCAGSASGCHSHQLPIKPRRRRTGRLRVVSKAGMHIFVADEPSGVSSTRAAVLYRFRPPQASTTQRMGWRKEEAVRARKWLPFYPSSKA